MSDEAKVAIVTFLVTMIFGAGGLIMWIRISLADMRKDMNGIGNKMNSDRAAALRRHHNTTLAIVRLAVVAREKNICELLKEE